MSPLNTHGERALRISGTFLCVKYMLKLNNPQDNQDYTIDAIVDRHAETNRYPYVRVNRYPWSSELRYPEVARFLHQTIHALVPGETTWNNSVAAVGFMEHHVHNANLTRLYHLWRADVRMRLRSLRNLEVKLGATFISMKDAGTLLKGSNGEVEVTADNVPVVWDHDTSDGVILVSSMSRETWVREWLP
jgi:hypothetical protein